MAGRSLGHHMPQRRVLSTTLRGRALEMVAVLLRRPAGGRRPAARMPAKCSAASTCTTSSCRPTERDRRRPRPVSSAIAAAGSGTGAPLQPYVFGAAEHRRRHQLRGGRAVGEVRLGSDGTFARALASRSTTARPANSIRTDKIAFGSRVLFEPEIGIGTQVNGRLSVEASWVHMSHAQLFGRENPGIDNLGVRLNSAL